MQVGLLELVVLFRVPRPVCPHIRHPEQIGRRPTSVSENKAPKQPSSYNDWGFVAFMILMVASVIVATGIGLWKFLH